MARFNMDDIIAAVNDLPALPHVVFQIMDLTDDPRATAQDVGKVISQDQGLTAKVLRLANSAYYGYSRKVATASEATVLLGFATIRSIVIAASMSDILNRELTGYALGPGDLWKHSFGTAMASRYIAQKSRFEAIEVAYTAGLLHDIGKVILNKFMKEIYHEVVEEATQCQISFLEAEKRVLGFNHALIGSRVARKWKLPADIVEAIAFHHDPGGAEKNAHLTAVVHISDALCSSLGLGVGADGMLYPVSKNAMELLRFGGNDIEIIVEELSDVMIELQQGGNI
ncbi:MAG: HDOD domain-containing protein [Syntrophomonadaceae bacterium]|jgi:putative nucleotidyltransferase with HDIG domain